MPKKFKGENSKAVEARARKDAQKEMEKEKKEREKEDAYWKDDDKHVARKQQRKEDKDKKKQEQQEKKQQLKQLYTEEMSQTKTKVVTQSDKVTRAEIEANRERLAAAAAAAAAGPAHPAPAHDELPLVENVNRLEAEGEEARSVEEAISLLSTKDPEYEKHPEKRVKAAYTKYENENLPRLKQENPNMRLSQLKQLLKKDWMKSPENPLNQRHIAYNSK